MCDSERHDVSNNGCTKTDWSIKARTWSWSPYCPVTERRLTDLSSSTKDLKTTINSSRDDQQSITFNVNKLERKCTPCTTLSDMALSQPLTTDAQRVTDRRKQILGLQASHNHHGEYRPSPDAGSSIYVIGGQGGVYGRDSVIRNPCKLRAPTTKSFDLLLPFAPDRDSTFLVDCIFGGDHATENQLMTQAFSPLKPTRSGRPVPHANPKLAPPDRAALPSHWHQGQQPP